MKLVIATRNKDKLKEIKNIISEFSIASYLEILSLSDFDNVPEVIEDGKTLQENAVKKLKNAYNVLKLPILAEDTGLEVDSLGGQPGVYSARFAGEGCTYQDNVNKLLSLLKGLPVEKRKARFRTVAGICLEGGHIYTREGVIDGYIAEAPRGTTGFGYDPLFVPFGYDKTFAELPTEIKDKISHRALAIKNLKPVLLESLPNI